MAKLKKFKLWFRKRKKRMLLSFAVLLAVAGAGYGYRDFISAAVNNHEARPAGGELPQGGADPVQPAGSPPPPQPETEAEAIPPCLSRPRESCWKSPTEITCWPWLTAGPL